MSEDMKDCVVCGDETKNIFGIKFKATPVCEYCANTITLQQVKWLTEQSVKELTP